MRVNSNIPFKYYNYSIFCICMNHFLYALLRELKGEEGGGWFECKIIHENINHVHLILPLLNLKLTSKLMLQILQITLLYYI